MARVLGFVFGFELGLFAGEEPESVAASSDGGGEAVRSDGFAERRADGLESDGHFFLEKRDVFSC
jgi:hypothetical protein